MKEHEHIQRPVLGIQLGLSSDSDEGSLQVDSSEGLSREKTGPKEIVAKEERPASLAKDLDLRT